MLDKSKIEIVEISRVENRLVPEWTGDVCQEAVLESYNSFQRPSRGDVRGDLVSPHPRATG
jgi:hypothetical protein